jgi:hypothetical protein
MDLQRFSKLKKIGGWQTFFSIYKIANYEGQKGATKFMG